MTVSEFVLDARGGGEVAQHRADIWTGESVLADGSLFTPRSDFSESVSTPQTMQPSKVAVLLAAVRRCLSGTGDVRTPEIALGRLVQIGAPTRRSWMSQTAQGLPRSLFRIG